MRVAYSSLILVLALCVLCAAEDRRIRWTVDEIQQYGVRWVHTWICFDIRLLAHSKMLDRA